MNGQAMAVAVWLMLVGMGACTEAPNSRPGADRVSATTTEFAFIDVSDRRITTQHELKYVFESGNEFVAVGPTNRTDNFDGADYLISLAALLNDERALMLHAEKVADNSGTSDYSDLPRVSWPDDRFRSDGPVCTDVAEAEVAAEYDLRWLRQNGFEPSGSILLAQYFTTTEDMNAEIVISLLQRLDSCGDSLNYSKIVGEFQAMMSVSRSE